MSIIETVQFVMIVLSVAFMILIDIDRSKNIVAKKNIMIVAVMSCVNSVAYFLELSSGNEKEIMLAIKVRYFSSIMALFYFMAAVFALCEFRHSRIYKAVVGINSIVVCVLILFEDRLKLLYKSAEFCRKNGFSYLESEKGPLYVWNSITMSIVELSLVIVVLIQYSKARKKEYILLALSAFVPMFFLLIRVTRICGGYNPVNCALVGSEVIVLIALKKYHMFDFVKIAKETIIDTIKENIVLVNSENKIIYQNEVARTTFNIDENSVEDGELINKIIYSDMSMGITYEEKHFSINKQDVMNNDRYEGMIIRIFEDTKEYQYKKKLESNVIEKTEKILKMQSEVIVSIANLIESRDGSTGEHVKRTTGYVELIGTELYSKKAYPEILTNRYLKDLINANVMHDIGKIKISDTILLKPGRLTKDEFEIIKTHSDEGGRIIKNLLGSIEETQYVEMAYQIARYHHERWDGTGYPEGLKGEEIPLCARIMAVADVFDALTSQRCYKEAMSFDDAYKIIEKSSGTHFDPIVVDAFFAIKDKIKLSNKA